MASTTETSTETTSQVFKHSLNDVMHWLGDNLAVFFRIVAIVVVAWLSIRIILKVFDTFLHKSIRSGAYQSTTDRNKRIKTLNSIIEAVVRCFVLVIAGIMILDVLGINIAPLLASAGILGVALGFGTQSLVKDFITGIFIIAENQYRVGDFIDVQGVSGTVEHISIRTTVLRDLDGSVHFIPNGSIVVSTNRTMGEGHLMVDITVAPETDLKTVENIINQVGKQLKSVNNLSDSITEPPHFVRVSEFNDQGITVKVSSTVSNGKQPEIKSAFLTQLRQALKKENIKIVSAVSSNSKK